MKVQVLVAAMNQYDHSLLDKMNINSDVIVGNQCNMNSVEQFRYKNNQAVYLNFNEVGVGLNRNNALMRATGDICLFADDDMVYVPNYSEIVLSAFEKTPKADVIIFNLYEKYPSRYVITKKQKVNRFNYLRYGTARIAIRLNSIRKNGIYFNQCYGGGTIHSHGEDNIFLTQCLNAKMNIYAMPSYIATLTEERNSTWNHGYSDKYIWDQGSLYKKISSRWWGLLCLQDAVRHRHLYNKSFWNVFIMMIRGAINEDHSFNERL